MTTRTSTGSMSSSIGCLHARAHAHERSEPDVCYVHEPAVTVTFAGVVRLGAVGHLLSEASCARSRNHFIICL